MTDILIKSYRLTNGLIIMTSLQIIVGLRDFLAKNCRLTNTLIIMTSLQIIMNLL